MSAYMCISGECQFKGEKKKIESILEKWRLLDLLVGEVRRDFRSGRRIRVKQTRTQWTRDCELL